MATVNIKIEGIPYQVEEGLTILEAAKKCGYEIPSLCAFNKGECSSGSCRVCLVEVKGARGLVASCVYPVNEGMEIIISSPRAVEARRASVELLLSNHNQNCQQCDKNGHCELLHVAFVTGAREGRYVGGKNTNINGAVIVALYLRAKSRAFYIRHFGYYKHNGSVLGKFIHSHALNCLCHLLCRFVFAYGNMIRLTVASRG